MPELFDRIVIRYDGLDAKDHEIDLALLGESLKGGARLLAVAGHLALTGTYVTRTPAMSIRVLASAPEAKCLEIATSLVSAVPMLPLLSRAGRELAKKAVEAIVNYMLAKLSGKPNEAAKAMEIAMAAIAANKEVTLKSLDTVALIITKAAEDQRPAARAFAAPVGVSVATAVIGAQEVACVIDEAARDEIEREEPIVIGPVREFTVMITELDVKTGACKVVLKGDDSGERYSGEITDPVVRNPRSPYSTALDSQRWIKITAKPHVSDGELKKTDHL